MATKALDRLQDRYPDCAALVFADLSTQMALITNTETAFRRETLDSLCAEAALAFGTKGGPAIGDSAAMTVFVATRDHLRIYLRSAHEPDDALCCICAHDTAIDSFVKEARASCHGPDCLRP